MRRYTPPPLNTRVRVRDPDNPPDYAKDDYGNPVGEIPEWGRMVWANRHDRFATTALEEGVAPREIVTTWTIRERDDLGDKIEFVDGDDVYLSIGLPIRRGGSGTTSFGGRYLEIDTELRK